MSINQQTISAPKAATQGLRTLKRQNLVEEVVRQMRDQIIRGEWKAGGPMPSEGRLCEDMGVSRTVVREAMRMLSAQGLVEVSQGKRPRVKHADPDTVIETIGTYLRRKDHTLLDLLEVRRPMEAEIASLAALRAKPPQIKMMHETINSVSADSPIEELIAAEFLFHATLAEASGNPLFPLILEALANVMKHSHKETLERTGLERARSGHRAILKAVRNGDSVGARKAMVEHLKNAEEDLRGNS